MSGLVWLASYPKSGNTWFRMIVANLAAQDEPADINNLPEGGGIASNRGQFEQITLVESGLLTHDEAEALRPQVHRAVRRGQSDEATAEDEATRLVKAHDAYVMTSQGEPLLGGRAGADGAILIVRDPRDVAPSLANHLHRSLDDAIAFLNSPASRLVGGRNGQSNQLRQRLLDWSGHAASWLDQCDLPVHLLRYEDLWADPVDRFLEAMAFAGREVTRADAERAVEFASFDRLQAQERERGFGEWRARHEGELFFRRGRSRGWRDELTPEQITRIEAAHAPMMARLGYGTSGAETSAASGSGDQLSTG